MYIFFLFILGISIGSFLNVLIDRMPRNESIVYKRSHCESCKKTLSWYDLIPFLSFIFLKGRCRYCNVSLSSIFAVSGGRAFNRYFIYWGDWVDW
ncbi:MAG: prepilin peptidase [Candidatus Levybacteria bacterium]|nr:prepilin peptidase [Candidatus Levybacteria bacterium]